jgi:ribokinase
MVEVDLVVVGSLNMDLVLQCSHLPAPGETLLGSGFAQVHGGKGANQAVAAARAGARVAMVGAVGQDAYGYSLLEALQADSIDTRHVQILPHHSTGVASIWLANNGQNSILLHGGANQQLSALHVEHALAELSTRALLLQGEVPEQANAAALAIARARSWVCGLNPAPMQPSALPMFALADLVVLNETEAALALQRTALVVQANPQQAVQDLCQQFEHADIVLTLGAQGLWHGRAAQHAHYPAAPVQVVDTTAAGDTLTGALLAGLLRGEVMEQALRGAIAAAGLCVSQFGAQSSIPFRQPTIAANQ